MKPIQIVAGILILAILVTLTMISIRMEKLNKPVSDENGHEYQMPGGKWLEVRK